MSEPSVPTTKATLGLTGLTSNAMALIAPGAFLWLAFAMQSLYGAPMAGTPDPPHGAFAHPQRADAPWPFLPHSTRAQGYPLDIAITPPRQLVDNVLHCAITAPPRSTHAG